jgi:UDP-glucose:glycoprotein glucosyltransferase
MFWKFRAGDTVEVSGFLFDRLHDLHPEASVGLDALQNHLAATKSKKSEFEALKAWQVQELGLQASHFVTLQGSSSTSSGANDFLTALLDISGNFPSRAAALSSVRVPAEFKRAVGGNQRLLQSQFNLDEGDGAFFLQGSYLDPDALDLFTFMDSIKVGQRLKFIIH